jgi:hypothetical protein
MKTKLTTLLALLLATVNLLRANEEPYYEIASILSVTQPVTYETVWQRPLRPRDQDILVPAAMKNAFNGINIGFTIHNTVNESPEILKSLVFTKFAFSVYHLREDGSRDPVICDAGQPVVDVPVLNFGSQDGIIPYVAIVEDDINTGRFEEAVNTGPLSSPVQDVEGILVRNHTLPWDFCIDFTRPQVGEGYVVEWDIRFIPTASNRITYPETNLREQAPHYKRYLTFTYKVEDFEMPQMTKLEIEGDDTFVTFKGKTIEYFVLERSNDLREWEELRLSSPAIMNRWYLGANTFWWHLDNNNESREFYRLRWKPEQQFLHYREQSAQHRIADTKVEWFVVSEESSSFANDDGVADSVVFELTVDVTAIDDKDIYIHKNPENSWGPISVLNHSERVRDDPNLEAIPVLTTDGRTEESGNFWVVREGETARFTLTIAVDSIEPNPGLQLVMPLISFRYRLVGDPHPTILFDKYGFQLGILEE